MSTLSDECREASCPGLFVDSESLAVTRCDACEKFSTDQDAADCADVLISMLSQTLSMTPALTIADVLDVMARKLGVNA